jgi:RNA polymerase sigma-70 factor (ECF subfamily)
MTHSSDESEFVALVDSHGSAVMGLLHRLCRNQHDAEEVFQEVALRVWKSFSSQPRPPLENPRGWLMTIAYRTFLDKVASRRTHESLVGVADRRAESPYSVAEEAERRDSVHAAIDELAPPIREVVVLHYVGGMTLRETARAMQISEGTAKSRLNSALVKMRRVLE